MTVATIPASTTCCTRWANGRSTVCRSCSWNSVSSPVNPVGGAVTRAICQHTKQGGLGPNANVDTRVPLRTPQSSSAAGCTHKRTRAFSARLSSMVDMPSAGSTFCGLHVVATIFGLQPARQSITTRPFHDQIPRATAAARVPLEILRCNIHATRRDAQVFVHTSNIPVTICERSPYAGCPSASVVVHPEHVGVPVMPRGRKRHGNHAEHNHDTRNHRPARMCARGVWHHAG